MFFFYEFFGLKIKYKRYPKYKDSGVDWLGEIPEGWNFVANKHIFRLKKIQVGKKSNEYDLLSLTLNGIVKRVIEDGGKFPAEFDTYQEVQKGDFVFCLFDVEETPRTIGLSKFNGMITGAYTVMQLNDKFDKVFLYYYYLNLDSNKRLKPLYRGLRNTIPKETFFSLKTFPPPLPEQTAIAHFLDDKTAKIDKAIANKQKLIELLKERKQIIIQDLVTGKMKLKNGKWVRRPKSEMKDSGVEWIGEIPEGWEVVKLRNLLKPFSEKNNPHLPLLSITREKGVIIRDIENQDENHNFIPDDLSGYKVLKIGQFGMNKMKAWQGSYGVSKYTGIVSPAYYIFDFLKNINEDFFNKAIRSKIYISFFGKASDGVRIGQWDLSKSRMKEIPFFLPPLQQQQQIVNKIEAEIQKIEKAISLQEKQIEKLKEYKQVLIDSAVTGKIKVS